MEYYAIAGMMIIFLIAIYGVYSSLKKNIQTDREPFNELNVNIVKLNANFEHMLENDEIRDKRINKHGEEIDQLTEKQRHNEKILDLHELRIGSLEERVKDKNKN